MLHKFVDFCFDEGESNFILLNYFRARWVKDTVNYIFAYYYSTVSKKIFSQIIGIRLGSDPAPFFPNLFLYYYESRWIKDLQKKDLKKGKFCNVFCFIYDLNAINDAGIFENNFRDIYPEELEWRRENGNSAETTFLDLDIKIKNKFQIGLFNKREKFSF